MPKKIAVLDTGYEDYNFEKNLLAKNGYELQVFVGEKADLEGKIALSKDAEGLFIRWTIINDYFLNQCPNVKVIVRYGAGYENVDLEAASRANVKVCNVGGYGNHSVSDHAISLMYACARGLLQGASSLKRNFGKPPFNRMFEMHRKTLGIIGLGRIGGTLATKAVHLFEKVMAYDPYIPDTRFKSLNVDQACFEDVLKKSDVISLHCNLTEETRHLINGNAFAKMKKAPVLINTSRGPVVETGAMLGALHSQQIFRAGLDVFNSEIPDEIPDEILNHPNIIATGHYAWYSENSIAELQKRAAENMVALLQGKPIEDLLN